MSDNNSPRKPFKDKQAPKGPPAALFIWLLILITFVGIIIFKFNPSLMGVQEWNQTKFEAALNSGYIATADITPESDSIYYIVGKLKPDYKPAAQSDAKDLSKEKNGAKAPDVYSTRVTASDELMKKMEQKGVEVKVLQRESWWKSLIVNLVIGALIIGFIYFLFSRQLRNAGGGAMQFGKSRARMIMPDEHRKKFDDVAGCDEAKEETKEIVDYLKDPLKYKLLGGKIPKGALLIGPPGTGKTLMAKAVAGEACVPFFSISGSDFVEMFVGVGASRVRDLFEEGKKHAPCIIFIDEIDAVARRRGTGMGGGHDEREQTLNQLLVEMDGFGVNEGIIVMAATNRVDILDPAILRPGRFDRRVVVGPPDVMGREEILKVHAKNKPLAEDVDLKQIAQTTAGFTGAELENLLNEAAIMAAKDRRRFVRQSDIKSAFIKVGIGAEKRSKVISDKEKRITAYHETGHAILFHMLPDMEAVYTISIIPTGPGAAGYTMPQPENDDMFQTRGKMMQYITVCLGGRVAEELIFDDITTGASQDIKQATATARSMITKYGMSENLGLVAYDSDSDEVFIGRDWGHTKSYSENVAAAIDEEVRQMIEKCHDQAKRIILEHSYVLHECAKQLMEKEKLSRAEFEAIFEQEAQMTGTAPEVSGEI